MKKSKITQLQAEPIIAVKDTNS